MFFNLNSSYKTSATICRFIVRDFCGKNCWDCCLLHPPDENRPPSYFIDLPYKKAPSEQSPLKDRSSTLSDIEMDSDDSSRAKAADQSGSSSSSKFDYAKLPFLEFNDIPKDIDILDNVRPVSLN